MRPITRRLRIFAAVLGLAQGAIPVLAITHELGGREAGAPVAHAESEGATHDVAAHAHECGLCRTHSSRIGLPAAPQQDLGKTSGSSRGIRVERFVLAQRDEDSPALPRGPPVG